MKIRWYNRLAAWLFDFAVAHLTDLADPVWIANAEADPEWMWEAEDRDAEMQSAMSAAYNDGLADGYRQAMDDGPGVPF